MTYQFSHDDLIWKALGDARRRLIIEVLATGPKQTGDLVQLFPDIGRTGVLKHIDVLTEGGIIHVRREGRTRWNHLDPEPIRSVCNSWVAKHIDGIKSSATKLKLIAEKEQ
ncbi:metalloregulator ArsR/SmtB family transcription factor [Pontixanthobacter sp. CEM42]|uniref:ArsR/SmtB family transcription factor n=1 Tax=Pontixanthobacter sp. CEM42 TaxID=2792077 RepID=UPI001AE0DA51|nr:metalloregulator ArsR/SmtB family transcription factor [Pontixanthobacter sp. CEM42]